MERVLKENGSRESANAKRVAQGRFAPNPLQGDIASRINNSPYMIAQRKKLQSLFGGAAQLQGAEEELLQGKFAPVQLQAGPEEEELLQGKFETTQRVEDEELLQGKFEAVQRVEEEEPLQGRFAPQPPAQLEQQPAAKPNNTGLPDNLKSGI